MTFLVAANALDHASVFIFLAVRFTVAALLMPTWSYRARRFRAKQFWSEQGRGGILALSFSF
jgi:hypothetical protein